jgi:hypothetical protein
MLYDLQVIRERIPVFPETSSICSALSLDPMKLLASGALLIAVAPDGADSVLTAIRATCISVGVIGEVRPSSEGITIMTNGNIEPLTPAVRDEIARRSKTIRRELSRGESYVSGLLVRRSSGPREVLRPDFLNVEFCCTLAHRLQDFLKSRRLALDPAQRIDARNHE